MENSQQAETKKKHIRKQNFIALVILIVGTLLSFVLFGSKKVEETQPEEELVKTVKIIRLSRTDFNQAVLEKTVKFSSPDSGEAIAEYSGRIKQVNFNIGDYVSTGQVLAVFDQSNTNNSAKISLDSTKKSLELAEKNLKQTKEIADKSIDLAKSGVNIAEIQLKQAENGGDKKTIELAEENLEIAKDQKKQAEHSAEVQINGVRLQAEQARLATNQAQAGYEKTFIKAPVNGYVVSKNVNPEDYINPGTSIAQIAKEGRLEGRVYLNQDEAERISKGDTAEIIINEKSYYGIVASVSDIANSDNQRFETVIKTSDKLLKQANQSAVVKLNLQLKNDQGFFIPLEAANIGQTRNEVFIVENGKAKAMEIELGKIIGQQVEVTSGLREGDAVVIEGNRNLQEGETVVSNR